MPKFETRSYRVSELMQVSRFPHLSLEKKPTVTTSDIDDYEGLFIDYGRRETSYPYTQQNLYSEETEREITVAVLENEYLYAEFLPSLGGRLWKLYDKKRRRSVIYTNDVIRFRNLAVRNAWFSGGVEWNCGVIGHSPFTCSPMYCARVTGRGGEDVLRFYEFERTRSIYYQIDFWLEGCKLMTCVRIENPNAAVVPMYWWSNMATPEYAGGRVAVSASEAYNNSDGMGIKKSPIPVDGGDDVSYPENIPNTIDYFYKIPDAEDKFIANVSSDGLGLLQFSSGRLKGRKLFSWGHLKGSAHWQRMLTDKAGDYVEIQAGLGRTQYECIPMPPKCVWSFAECYTLADIDKSKLNAPYDEFVAAVKAQIASLGGCRSLDERLADFERDISLQKGEVVSVGSGFGCLNARLGGKAPRQLQFRPADDVKAWVGLLQDGRFTSEPSFAYGERMKELLLRNSELCDSRIPYQLALLAYDERDFESAKAYCERSFLFGNDEFNNHLYAFILYQLNDEKCIYFAEKALRAGGDSYALAESIFSLLLRLEAYDILIKNFEFLSDELKRSPRLLMYLAKAYAETGDPRAAEDILTSGGGLTLLDFREGDRFLDRLYRRIRTALYGENYRDVTVPEQFDFIVSDFKTE